MNIRDELVCLSQLALADSQLKDLTEQKKSLPKKAVEADERAQKLLTQTEKLEARSTDLNLRRRKLEGDLQTEKANLRKWESRANQIRGEREYTSLMSEIGSQKRTISDLENQILEVMESEESVTSEVSPLRAGIESVQKTAQDEWALVKDDLATIDGQLEELSASHLAIKNRLSPSTIKRYEQIAAKRAGVGIAFVKKEVCQACSRMIPAELCLRVMKGEALEQCPSCHRLLTV